MATNAPPQTMFYVVRVHQTDAGPLSVYAERFSNGDKRGHTVQRAAMAAADLLGGAAAGFHVLEMQHDHAGQPCAAQYVTANGA